MAYVCHRLKVIRLSGVIVNASTRDRHICFHKTLSHVSLFTFNKVKYRFSQGRSKYFSGRCNYVGHLESKERLRIQHAQLFNFS